MPRSKKKIDEGFWVENGEIERENSALSRVFVWSRDDGAKIHSTVKIDTNADNLFQCVIGPRTVIGKYAYLEGCQIGADCVITDGVNLIDVVVPDGSWVESTCVYGRGNHISMIWTPDRPLMIKPGCWALEPVDTTLARLSKPREIYEWSCLANPEEEAKKLTEFLLEMKEYRCVW